MADPFLEGYEICLCHGVMKHFLTEAQLRYRQALPLEVKVVMSTIKIQRYLEEYGTQGVYVSFSGGKDSTVLMDLARKYAPDIPAVFLDTWLEYPQVREFVRSYQNVEVIKPTMGMKEIIQTYG